MDYPFPIYGNVGGAGYTSGLVPPHSNLVDYGGGHVMTPQQAQAQHLFGTPSPYQNIGYTPIEGGPSFQEWLNNGGAATIAQNNTLLGGNAAAPAASPSTTPTTTPSPNANQINLGDLSSFFQKFLQQGQQQQPQGGLDLSGLGQYRSQLPYYSPG